MFTGALALLVVPTAMRAEPAAQRRKKKDAAASASSPSSTPEPTESPSESPTGSPGEQNPAVSRLRLWKASDAPGQTLHFQLVQPDKPDAKSLTPIEITAESYQLSGYVDVPAGEFVAEFGGVDRPAVRLPLHLTAGGQSTILVRVKGGTITAEWINDAITATGGEGEFAVFNLLPASGDVQVDLGSITTVHLPTVHSHLHLVGIKRAAYPVTISGTDGAGKEFRWNTDADFRQCRKATLLIYPDNYGRIRPRVITN